MNKIYDRAVSGQAAKASFINSIVDAVNALIDQSGEAAGMTDEEREQMNTNTMRISAALTRLNRLESIEHYEHVFMEEDVVNALTSSTAEDGVLYFGMEPIEQGGEEDNTPTTFVLGQSKLDDAFSVLA